MFYQAIMKAADHIEQHPEEFNFLTWSTPNECGTPGCALGWIGFFAGMKGAEGHSAHTVAHSMGLRWRASDRSDLTFYNTIDALLNDQSKNWHVDAALCAKGLRLYAERYHGHEKLRPTQKLVANLMTKVMGEEIPEDVPA